jgi:hypothetical protein
MKAIRHKVITLVDKICYNCNISSTNFVVDSINEGI